MTCQHRMFDELDGLPCSLVEGHDGGHVAELGSWVPDSRSESSHE